MSDEYLSLKVGKGDPMIAREKPLVEAVKNKLDSCSSQPCLYLISKCRFCSKTGKGMQLASI